MRRLLFIVISILFLTACSAMVSTETLVKQNKWYEVGLRDGERGLTSRSMSELNALAKNNGLFAPNVVKYETGYKIGIDRFCNLDNAYDIGLSGMNYNGVCANQPDGLQFSMDWQRGFSDFQSSGNSY